MKTVLLCHDSGSEIQCYVKVLAAYSWVIIPTATTLCVIYRSRPPATCQDEVIGQRFPTPQRAVAASRLASQQVAESVYRPGLSAGISGAGIGDAASVSSALSSLAGGDVARPRNRDNVTASTSAHQQQWVVCIYS